MSIAGTTAVITGASSGIGEAISRRLDQEGLKLLLVARSAEKLSALASELKHASTLALDVTDEDAGERILARVAEDFGHADILVNSAGMMAIGKVDEIDFGKARAMLRLNTEATIMAALVFAKNFKTRGAGTIINISSVAGYKPQVGMAAYNASKFAVEAFTDALRLELVGTGVKVGAVAPGTVQTALYDDWNEENRGYVFSGGSLAPEDVADVVQYMLDLPANVELARVLVVPPNMPV